MSETARRRRFPWLKVALALSLVVNLVFVGIFAGVFHRAGQGGSVLRAAFSALPAEDRRQLRRETGAIWREARGARETPRAPTLMIDALRAEEFEQDAFAEALHAAQRRLLHLSDEMHAQLIAHVASMSPADRARYADALEEQMQARRWRRH